MLLFLLLKPLVLGESPIPTERPAGRSRVLLTRLLKANHKLANST